jgi:hypothetical protein
MTWADASLSSVARKQSHASQFSIFSRGAELVDIGGHDCSAGRAGDDEQVVAANRFSSSFQFWADTAMEGGRESGNGNVGANELISDNFEPSRQ